MIAVSSIKQTRLVDHLRVPNFLLIGAAKSATSWLIGLLGNHPQIFAPEKELHYFSWHYDMFNPIAQHYVEHFDGAGSKPVLGENSNTYLADPGAAARIAHAIPHCKLLVCLRNPVERAYSDYCMHLRLGRVTGDIHRYLDPAASDWPSFIEGGEYRRLLQRFRDLFPREQLHCILYDRIQSDPLGVFNETCRFLGVRPVEDLPAVATKVNVGAGKHLSPTLRNHLNYSRLGRAAARAAKALGIEGGAKRLLGRTISYPPLPEELRLKLALHYCDDVQELASDLGFDLTAWLGEPQTIEG